jgi:hypothetical protein
VFFLQGLFIGHSTTLSRSGDIGAMRVRLRCRTVGLAPIQPQIQCVLLVLCGVSCGDGVEGAAAVFGDDGGVAAVV